MTLTPGAYVYTCKVTDDYLRLAADDVTVTVNEAADTTKPVITLLGEATVTLTVGENYTDAGATASDNKDGDITANIQTNSTVNTATAGTYTVTYNVSDAAGNAADSVTRTVVVNEAAEPNAFGAFGNLEVLRYPNAGLSDDNYVIYYPEKAIMPDTPVVIF